MRRLPLTIEAVVAPVPSTLEAYGDNTNQPLSEAIGLTLNGGVRSASSAASTVCFEPRRPRPPQAVLPGQVIGLKDLKLSVGNGPEGSSIFSSTKRNVRLAATSQLVLVPSAGYETGSTIAKSTTPATVAAASLPTPSPANSEKTPIFTDDTEACASLECTIDNVATITDRGAETLASISLAPFGYSPRLNREHERFDYDSALAYLGEQQLLFTFNPHRLVHRSEAERSLRNVRTIQAELIDANAMRVTKVLQWRVSDQGQYLWPVGSDGVLVHSGQELRMYGPGLKLRNAVSLKGPLAFVRISPAGKYFAVGVIRERHTERVHQALLDAENREPEEEVELKVFNENFVAFASLMQSSREPWPVLSDTGELRVFSIGKERWRIVENTWDRQRRVLVQCRSSCVPKVVTMSQGLLFVVGCDRSQTGKWYRMVGSEGKSILKGWSSSQEIERIAIANASGNTFAIGITTATSSLADEVFRGTDLESQRIGVYDSRTGHPLLGIRFPSPVPTTQTFSLSPTGNILAVLTKDKVALYKVPPTQARSGLGNTNSGP